MRILILAPWSIATPLHGGQIRCSRSAEAYRAAGHAVRVIGIYDPSTATVDCTDADHPISRALLEHTARVSGTRHMAFWHALAEEGGAFGRYRDEVAQFAPDVIQFDEPFLWPLVQRLLESGALDRPAGRVRLMHSSYNVEHAWRQRQPPAGDAEWPAFLGELEAMEYAVARAVDAVCVVSETDAEAFRAMGADYVVVAPNGTAAPEPTAEALRTARQYPACPFALFVSSAHPPNGSGILAMMREAPLARLRNGVLLVCGTVEQLLRPHAEEPGLQHLFRRVRMLGRVSNDLLAALYATAHVTIVPRTCGGGSNLKTAEALFSGRPIVATSRALLGFEGFGSAAGLQVTDEPETFWHNVDRLLGEPHAAPIEREGVARLTWAASLRPMVATAEGLVHGTAAAATARG